MSQRFLKRFFCVVTVLYAAGCTLNTPAENLVIGGAPVVSIISPAPNAAYLAGVAVNIQAQITNAGEDIDRVEIAVDNALAATLPDPNTLDSPAFNIVYTWTAAGEGAHDISVTAFRADGSSSAPAAVSISVRSQDAAMPSETLAAPTATVQTNTASPSAATNPGQPTQTRPSIVIPTAGGNSTRPPTQTQNQAASAPPAAAGSGANAPVASFSEGINVRRGPGTNFAPPIGSFTAGQSTQILATNLDATWYKIRYGTGEGWVYAPLTTVTGSTADLPREPGPPTPIPPTATPVPPTTIPATAAPASNINLVAGIVVLEPSQPRCAETFVVGFDVANLGSAPSNVSSTVSLRDVRAADGSVQSETVGGFPVLQPGETFRVTMPITISTWYNEDHRLLLTIDPGNQVPENNDGDNTRELTYRLDRANCP
ncbi:MAG: CARDB domain-containing protein [bacterium]|nr:CARDB domain-containing protein [bacterium]